MGIATLSATLAYIGPGPGLSMTWALIGLVGTVLSAVAALLFWPVKVMLRRLRGDDTASTPDAAASPAAAVASGAGEVDPGSGGRA